MKKIIRTIAVVGLMFAVTTGFSSEPKLSLTPNAEKSLSFKMDATTGQTAITIIDSEQAVIYSEEIGAANTYSKKFDLKNLPEGKYFLKIEDDLKLNVFSFSVVGSKIELAERLESNKPVFTKKAGKVVVYFLNSQREDVKIKVVDNHDRVVYEEEVTNDELVNKVFNFDSAFAGEYKVMVQNTKSTYYENFSVE